MTSFFRLLLICCCSAVFFGCQSKKDDPYATWAQYGGTSDRIHYSSLTQIDTSNVGQLRVAWEYRTGDADTVHHSQIQCNPIVVDGVLYGTSPQMKLFAVEAATGRPKWVFNPFDSLAGDNRRMFFVLNNSRGVTYWSDGGDDGRIFYTAGSRVYAVDAETGRAVTSFGDQGSIDLHDGLDRDGVADLFITSTTPGIVFEDLLIMGSRVDEGPKAAPGHIRAYDVRTGERRWIFHTVPQPGEEGFETWDDSTAYRFIGGANCWSGFSLDEERGIVYAATGSASYDFYGGRRLGDNLFANCLLALDARTGKRRWHYQYIHHDIWDRDLSSPPALVTIERDGRRIDAAALSTKTGYVFLFDRETGEPLFEIEERPVPTDTELAGERLSPTQPFPKAPAPYVRQVMTESDLNPLLPDASYQDVKQKLASYRTGFIYNPLTRQGTVVLPGLDGGGEWGGPTFDPTTGLFYVNANEMAWVMTIEDVENQAAADETYHVAGQRLYQVHCMACHGAELKGSGNNPGLVGISERYTPADFDQLVQSGRRMMPAFKQLPNAERQAIATFVLQLQDRRDEPFTPTSVEADPREVPYTVTGYNKFLSKEGWPALAPPWGTLNALHLGSGRYVWRDTLGQHPAFPGHKTGTENYGGSVVTAGGLLFIAATMDGKFRAFNKRTGELLWEYDLPAPGFATPAVYGVGGRQYVVIACGGGKLGTKSGDSYVAFALPE